MSEDKTFEMMKTFKERQDKFIYYITGLNVASIGFILSKTFDLEIKALNNIFLSLALISCLLSIALAFRWIFIQFRTMVLNMDVLSLVKGHYDKNSISEFDKQKQISKAKRELIDYSKKAENSMKLTYFLFLFGIIFFILWRVFVIFHFQI